jgi:hypothetical protein
LYDWSLLLAVAGFVELLAAARPSRSLAALTADVVATGVGVKENDYDSFEMAPTEERFGN